MPTRPYTRGTGPGPITPDGCAVECYARLRPHGEPELIHGATTGNASILELGAGTGRITHPLLALGHLVVAVDESPAMLEHIRGAEVVSAPIESLALGRRFDAVVLMSFLIEIPEDDLMRAFLRTCRDHVLEDGCVILERHAPDWHATVRPHEYVDDLGRTIRLRDISRQPGGLVSLTVDYETGTMRWSHSFTTRHLDDDRMASELAAAGLRIDRFLTPDRRWVRAVPVRRPGTS